jgi:hypothetical protein
MAHFVFLHQLKFEEIGASTLPVVDLVGNLWGGPDRKNVIQRDLWLAWQKDVQAASNIIGKVPVPVMDQFQATKIYNRPPWGETKEAATPVAVQRPRFTWSYTSMQEFITCPAMWAAKRFYKTIKEAETEQQRWGQSVHEANEKALKGAKLSSGDKKIIDESGSEPYLNALLNAKNSGAELMVEREMCFTEDLKPCGWKDWNTVWVRGKGDVLVFQRHKKKVVVYDWKTGKIKDDVAQIELMLIFASWLEPEIETFDGKLIFLKYNKVLGLPAPLNREQLQEKWAGFLSTVNQMQQAWNNESFRKQTNGLCRQYCGNRECPHCGRG